jgi:broad-specificity NMP kinase
MSCKIIGFGGHIGVGKTTVSKQIKMVMNRETSPVYIVAVGNNIREELISYYGIPEDLVYDPKRKYELVSLANMSSEAVEWWHTFGIVSKLIDPRNVMCTIRALLQIHGTEIRRKHFGEDYWDIKFEQNIEYLCSKSNMDNGAILVDDIRFKGEVGIMQKYNAKLYRIKTYPGYDKDISHSSEHDLDDFAGWDKHYNPNYGTLELFDTVTKDILYNDFDFAK